MPLHLSLIALTEYAAAFLCAVGATALACKKKFGWIALLIGCFMYGAVFFSQRLYANVLLQVAFIILGILGIWNAYKAKPEDEGNEVPPLTLSSLLIACSITALAVVLCWYLLRYYSDDPYPWLDGILSALSLLAQYWMARKYAISWLLWLVTDAVYAAWFILALNMRFTGCLYIYLSLLSIHGYLSWKKSVEGL